jgi:hypothetical protein
MNSGKTRIKPVKWFFGGGVFLLLAATLASAQAGRGGINGLVTDPSGAAVTKAKVTALNHATGISESTVSTAAGLYSFVSLNPGNYAVTASAPNFETVARDNVTVSVDQVSTVNIALRVGSVNEVVTVTETSDLVDTDNSTVGQLIPAEVIDRVPLLTRDVFQLVQLSAGVLPANGTPNASDTLGIFNARPEIDVSSYTINGSLQGNVYYMLDGSPIGIAENNAASIIPAFQVPEDGVDEYRVETQNTPATYQSGGGGVISLASKSGGDKFHGDAFVYVRPNALAANDYFYKLNFPGQGTPDFYRYQEGGAISGPILRKKLFFFGDYEATQQKQYDGGGTFTVPTEAERTGDFSADGFTIYDPLLPDKADGTRQPFPGNKIPAADLNPIALEFAAQFPKPTGPGIPGNPYHPNNFSAPGLDPQNAQKFDIRMDYYQSEKQRIFGRVSFDRLFFSDANFFNNDYYSYYYQNITNARNVLLGDDLTLSPTSVLQLRYSFTRHYEDQTGDPRQLNVDIASLGFPTSLASQVRYRGLPVMNFGDGTEAIGGTNNYNTFIFASENSDASATYTKVLGKHEMAAGGEFQKRYMNIGQPPFPNGQYGFDNTPTSSTTFAGDGSDFGAFLLGMGQTPGSESTDFTIDLFAAESNPYYAAFFQDNYHVTHTLTLNLGLRWDIFGGRNERHNRLEYFDPTLQFSPDSVPVTGGEVFAKSGARSPFGTNLSNIGPRASFAWQPIHKVVVRGGGGIYYGPSTEMVGNTGLDSDGFATQTNWDSTNYNADGNTIFNSTSNCPNAGVVTGCYSLSNPFPGGLVEPTGSSLGPTTNLGSTLATVLHSPRTLTTYNFNFGIEYQFPHDTVLSAAYVGSRGLFLPLGSVDVNQFSLQSLQHYGTSLCVVPDSTCVMVPNKWEAIQPSTNGNYGLSTVPLWVSLQPYPQFGNGGYGGGNGVNVNGYAGGDSDYSSLQIKIEKRMTKHFTTLAALTWGKLISDDAAPPLGFVGYHGVGSPQDWKNLNLEHSVSAQDVKYQFNWQLSYDLPVGQGRAVNLSGFANQALGGWTINTIVYLSTGVPIASPNGTEDPYFSQRVNLTCDPGKGAPHSVNEWFNYTCFSQPANLFAPGTAPAFLSSIRTDGAHDLDVSVYKNFKLPHEMNARVEASAYNFTNSVQMGYPNVFWNPSAASNPSVMAGFGQITNASNTPRQIQFGARFTF